MRRKRSQVNRSQTQGNEAVADLDTITGDSADDPMDAIRAQAKRAKYEGEKLTFTHGAEVYRPAPYYNMTVGPFELTVTVAVGESVEEAADRASAELQRIAEKDFRRKLEDFKRRAKLAQV